MSNYIHITIQSQEATISDLIRNFKKFTAKSILEKIQNSPESRREWTLERFKLATESHSRNKNYQFYFVSSLLKFSCRNMAIILKKCTATSLCGQN